MAAFLVRRLARHGRVIPSRRRTLLEAPATLLLVTFLALAPAACAADPDHVEVVTTSGERHRFSVEWARTSEQQARGLMNREAMDPGHGMIFVFDPPRPVAFWMKNTLIPLDMLFIAQGGEVVRIHRMAEPLSTATIPSEAEVGYVLELVGGTTERLGIEPGARLVIGDAAG